MAKYSGVNPSEVYTRWHWGYKPNRKVSTHIEGLKKTHPVVECGLFLEFHIDALPGVRLPKVETASLPDEAAEKPDLRYLSVFSVGQSDYNNNHLVFDPEHKDQRLYVVMSPKAKAAAAKLWDPGFEVTSLWHLAQVVGGRHAQRDDYPAVPVQPLGLIYYVTYYTLKEEEGGKPTSFRYIHRMGEENGVEPVLAVDATGQLYIAGGSYTCEIAGITQ